MNRFNRATREWLVNHPSPKEARDFVRSLELRKDEEEVLIRHNIEKHSLEEIAADKNKSYIVLVRLHKIALKRATHARKNAVKIM